MTQSVLSANVSVLPWASAPQTVQDKSDLHRFLVGVVWLFLLLSIGLLGDARGVSVLSSFSVCKWASSKAVLLFGMMIVTRRSTKSDDNVRPVQRKRRKKRRNMLAGSNYLYSETERMNEDRQHGYREEKRKIFWPPRFFAVSMVPWVGILQAECQRSTVANVV